jgi:hypothetical protein
MSSVDEAVGLDLLQRTGRLVLVEVAVEVDLVAHDCRPAPSLVVAPTLPICPLIQASGTWA